MAARTASQSIRERSPTHQSFEVEDAETTYAGSQVALAAGYLKAYTGAAGESPVGRGISQGSVLGATSDSPVPTHDVALEGYIIEAVDVAGATTIADVGSIAYLNDTDDIKADLTLTRPTRAIPFGRIIKFRTATSYDVRVYGMAELDAIQGIGQVVPIHLGNFDNAALNDGNLRTGWLAPFRCRILRVYAHVNVAFTGSGGTILVNLEIATVNVTGGVVTISTAVGGTVGTLLEGSSVTALNVLSEGVAVDMEGASAGGTQTAGNCDLYMDVERLPGV